MSCETSGPNLSYHRGDILRWVQNEIYSSGQHINKPEKLKETLYINVFAK